MEKLIHSHARVARTRTAGIGIAVIVALLAACIAAAGTPTTAAAYAPGVINIIQVQPRDSSTAENAVQPETSPVETSPVETSPGVDTVYIPDLVKPETGEESEKEVLLKEGPDIEVRFGRSLKELALEKSGKNGDFSVTPSLSFQRVDGLSLFLNEDFSNSERLYPRIHATEGYAFESKTWRYNFGLEQPLFSLNSFSFGGSVYFITDTFDKELTGNIENTLSSLLLKIDNRDYFDREGGEVFVKQKFLNWNTVKLDFAVDRFRSLPSISNALFYRKSREFRVNPPIDEGKWQTVVASYELDTRQDEQTGPTEHWYRLESEWGHSESLAGGGGGIFPDGGLRFEPGESYGDYTRLAADLRAYLNLNPGQYLSARLKVGATPRGTLPFQREFYVGGIGTLAAHRYKEFRGDHMILLNAEYAINVVKRFQVIMLTDAGKAWSGRDALEDQTLAFDVGIGIGVGEGIRVFAAKNPQKEHSEVIWTLRLQRTF